jgi:hypothetical protein
MKIVAAFLALLIALPSPGRAQEAVEPSVSTMAVEGPFTITAPRIKDQAALETARATGAGAAVAGTGLMAYSVFFAAAGPFGWAAALIFVGGMTAYLSHRRLHGKEDFAWGQPPPPTPPQAAKNP